MSTHYSIILLTLSLLQLSAIIHARYDPSPIFYGQGMATDTFYRDAKQDEIRPDYYENSQYSEENGYAQRNRVPAVAQDFEEERQSKSIEVPVVEPLPVPMALANNMKNPQLKKNSNSNYYMSLCHFKICNMGRKRNTRHLHLNNAMENLRRIRPVPAM